MFQSTVHDCCVLFHLYVVAGGDRSMRIYLTLFFFLFFFSVFSYHHTIFVYCESWGHPVLGEKANLPVHPAKKNKRLQQQHCVLPVLALHVCCNQHRRVWCNRHRMMNVRQSWEPDNTQVLI